MDKCRKPVECDGCNLILGKTFLQIEILEGFFKYFLRLEINWSVIVE